MVDIAAKPFNLKEADIQWVHETLAAMDVSEKIGQLFCPIGMTDDRQQLKTLIEAVKPGGMMFRPGPGESMQDIHRFLQEHSKLPLLISANLESGGNGITADGTYFGKQLQVAATDKEEMAYKLGLVAGREGRAVGCNWSFAPVVDIDLNFRNPITNVRTFGSDPVRVTRMAKAYTEGIQKSGLAVSVKHFPGDGVDERDQHLLTTVNSLSVDEWEATFGMVYRELIEAGAETVMVGHIMLPAYSRKLVPGIADEELMPATLAPELIGTLLRRHLGFNGLVVTDATPMAGFMMAEKREIAVPKSIAAGCDMFLFNKNIVEDFGYMMKGIESGILTVERLDEAVTRILALKASLHLHKQQQEGTLVPDLKELAVLQCDEHKDWAKECADQAVTLVKDTQQLLPIAVDTHKRILLYVLGDSGGHRSTQISPYMVAKLKAEGFDVTVFNNKKVDFRSVFGEVKELSEQYDLALYVVNIETASNRTTVRIDWEPLLGADVPWFVREIPTVFVSVASPYHLQDVPRVQTYVNAYSGSETVIDAVVDKLLGRSDFKGINPVDPFCGCWEAKL
ncbi:glycoside hydrolase family 3 protein [Paenibacillus alkaliterrae]|uniref:glycoside hydrolase family 3 protein n=1 Tax=Paenibacillus alkaliterrae TaxID=320909 RepID=UPI001F1698DF|nr:glycoside hydrolase family 3 N-terminal domain-containing protein [Paenibacillus alkaliterrae]MCF2941817.1 glycoside hydrolase family 3 protein [Paenibacillus alkaliterrae]